MEKYRFTVDGTAVNIYPVGTDFDGICAIADELTEGELAVVLRPDVGADIRAECFDKNRNEPQEPHLALAALFCFFKCVRSYPKMTLSVLMNEKTEEIDLSANDGFLAGNSGKCKILCAKTVKFSDEIEINAIVAERRKRCATAICEDAELFDEGRLRLLISHLSDEGVSAAMALSFSDVLRVRSLADASVSDLLLIAVKVITSSGKRLTDEKYSVDIDGKRRVFSYRHGALVVYPEIKYLC